MALRLLSLVPKIPVKAAVLIQSMPLLLVIKPVRSIEVKGNQWHLKNQKRIQPLVMVIEEKQRVSVDPMLKEGHQMLEKRKNN
jgi:hypothetical protein